MDELQLRILDILKSKYKGISVEEIENEIDPSYDVDSINLAINELEKKGKIFCNKNNQYLIWNNGLNRIFGKIVITKRGYGILKEKDGQIIIVDKDFLNGALSGDTVIINGVKKVNNRKNGKVEKIIERKNECVLCEVVNYVGNKKLVLVNDKSGFKIKVSSHDLDNFVVGDRLLVNIGLDKLGTEYVGKIIKKVCHKDDPKSDLITIAAIHGFDFAFPTEVQDEVKNIVTNISREDINNRVDLRNKIIFTIDGEDTKDIDDAISLEILPNGNYKLGVHIADVAHYVKPESKIFEEALKRGTSVYMIDSVIPMLPRELSNGICSLNPHEDRLTKTCEMEFDRHGNIINSRIFNSVICSRKKMSYENVNKILEDGEVPEGYEEFVDILKEMQRLSSLLSYKNRSRGALEFDKSDIKIKTDDKGKPYEIESVKSGKAELLIENFMVSANTTVAKSFSKFNLPFIYRVHESPNYEKLLKIIDKISHVNLTVKKPPKDMSSSKNLQKFMDSISDLKEYPAFVNLILKSMSRAEYSEQNIGHYGLSLKTYTHFTSPIRRFPDLLVHSLIDLYSNKNLKNIDFGELEKKISEMAVSSSQSEVEAQRAEFDANDLKIAEYMQNHIGEVYEGTIIDINEKEMRVKINDSIEGIVNISDIEPKTYQKFDRNRYCLVNNMCEYYLGDDILLRVKKADKKDKKVNFIAMGHVIKKSDSEKKLQKK